MLLEDKKKELENKIEIFEEFLDKYSDLRMYYKVKEIALFLDTAPKILSQYTNWKLAISQKRMLEYILIMNKKLWEKNQWNT